MSLYRLLERGGSDRHDDADDALPLRLPGSGTVQ